ncbi:hypothetical protein M5689_012612 [Euphorbia peplus]|nr:hypothetical protein M5689_012612 [Euphorbia peplus]
MLWLPDVVSAPQRVRRCCQLHHHNIVVEIPETKSNRRHSPPIYPSVVAGGGVAGGGVAGGGVAGGGVAGGGVAGGGAETGRWRWRTGLRRCF